MKLTKTRMFRTLQSMAINGILVCVKAAITILPVRLIQFVLDALFTIVSPFTKTLQTICAVNLRHLYGDTKTPREYQKAAVAYIRSVGHSMLDMLYCVQFPDKLFCRLHIHGEDHLKKALAAGKGVIAVSGHMGNFPLMFMSLIEKGYKVNVIIRPMRDPAFSQFMFKLCAQKRVHMIQTIPVKPFFKECLAALKRNELLFILLDEEVAKGEGVDVTFFGDQVRRAAGPMLFYRRMESPILPILTAKDSKSHHHIFVEPPFVPEESDQRNIAKLTSIIEAYVRRFPLQWGGWMNKRWAEGKIEKPQRSQEVFWGLQMFGWGLIVTSLFHMQKLVGDYDWYVTTYGYLESWMPVRYAFSWFQRCVGLIIGIGLLNEKKWAAVAGKVLGVFTILTVYWKHPYTAFYANAKMLDERYGSWLLQWNISPNLTFASMTVPALIVHILLDILFWSAFIYYVSRPQINSRLR